MATRDEINTLGRLIQQCSVNSRGNSQGAVGDKLPMQTPPKSPISSWCASFDSGKSGKSDKGLISSLLALMFMMAQQ